jgi:twitching motility protein PilJ
MDESIQRVVQGSKLANDAYVTLQELENVSSKVAKMVHTISTSAEEQALASETVSRTMANVGQISHKTSEATQKTARSMQVMAKTADKLSVSVEVFKVDDGAPLELTNEMPHTVEIKPKNNSGIKSNAAA